ncbi:CpaF family protein, partial [Phytoactinopolyspora endophytica]|uniref:CpaF family protein n=1 Tax=Phytoactinopolyspora endophytica TaxID=1642495 RepID=UPI00197B78AE
MSEHTTRTDPEPVTAEWEFAAHDATSTTTMATPAATPADAQVDGDDADPAERLRERLRATLGTQLPQRLDTGHDDAAGGVERRRELARQIVDEAITAHVEAELMANRRLPDREVEQIIVAEVMDHLFGAAGLQPLLADPKVENININGCDQVFVRYADGTRAQLPPVADSDEELVELVRTMAARSGTEERRFDRAAPAVNLQLPDGSRVFAVMALCARPSISVRRHRYLTTTLPELRELGVLDRGLHEFLAAAVRARKNILVAGGTQIGKTTLLRALASEIEPGERLVTVEDVLELALDRDRQHHPDVVALQSREANIEGEGAVSQAELVRFGLRMSPDRVIVGEIRGPEVVPMCNAMSQGNDGSMATLHASTSRGVFTRLAAYAAQGPEQLPIEATNLLVASAVHLVVHLAESSDRRRVVSSIREVVDADEKQITSNE